MATYQYTPMPAVEGPAVMSIGDMINTARAGQAYQQSQQINPLELQTKQQAARTGQIALTVEEQKDLERRNMQTVMSDPSQYMTDGKYDPNKAVAVATKVAPLTGLSYLKDMAGSFGAQETFKTAATGAESANLALEKNKSQVISNGYVGAINDPLVLQATKNPDAVDKNKLVEFVRTFGRNQAKASGVPEDQADKIMQPYFDIAQNNPAALRSYLIQRHIAGLDQSAQQGTYQTTTTVTPEGRTAKVTPGIGTQTVELGRAEGLQANVPAAPGAPGAANQITPGMTLPYPVRRADQPYMAEPTEQKDQAAGTEYRNNLVNGQMTLAESRRNVSEVMQTASGIGENLLFPSGGVLGKLEQKALTAMKSSEYEMLAKDLARMAMDTSRAMGSVGGTVAGLDMSAVANGTVKVPPEVLIKIARRVDAGFTNLDMQASGAQQFAQKFGDNNMKAYQQAWNANARDTRIFEAMNIMEKETDPNKMKKDFETLFPSEKKRKTILKQYRNLKSLAATGVIAEPLTPEDF
jgi:hypothetical protein